jgi:hypothetical protein
MADMKLVREKSRKKVHPALDTDDYISPDWPSGAAIVTQYLQVKNDKDEEMEMPVMVTSKREYYQIDEIDAQIRFIPTHMTDKGWNPEYIYAFLDNKSKGVDFASVFERVRNEYEYYMDFQDDRIYDFCALWTIGTYFHAFFNTYPYVFWNAMKASGKTKCLTLTEMMAFNAINATNISTSALFRLIQANKCTMLLDENENATEHQISEWKSILLSGYKRAGKVYRAEEGRRKGSKVFKVNEYEVYSPKMIANIGGVEDVLESRCIYLNLLRTVNYETGNREIDVALEKWKDIRNDLYLLLMQEFSTVIDTYQNLNIPDSLQTNINNFSELSECMTGQNGISKVKREMPPQSSLSAQHSLNTTIDVSVYRLLANRDMELWKPILVLAKCVSEELFINMLNFAVQKSREKRTEELSDVWDLNVLYALLELVLDDCYVPIKELKAKCIEIDSSMETTKNAWFGRALKRLGFNDKKRMGGGVTVGITKDRLHEVCNRYGIEITHTENSVSEEVDVNAGDSKGEDPGNS